MLALPMSALAERKYTVGTQLDFAAGGTNRPAVSGIDQIQIPREFASFYAYYPSIQLKSTGERSVFEASYVYGHYRANTDLDFESESHAVEAKYKVSVNRRLSIRLDESFETTPDFTTTEALRGIIWTGTEFRFLYYPVAVQRSSQSNYVNGGLEYDLSKKSSLDFSVSHSLRNYEDNPLFRGRLSDQYRLQGKMRFRRKLDERRSWSLEYSAAHQDFRDFENARIHTVSALYSHQLSPTLSVNFSGGPSYVETLASNRNYLGYSAYISLQKLIAPNRLSLYYSHDTGGSSGLGSVSEIDHAGLGLVRRLSRKSSITVDLSLFESRGRVDNPYKFRGASASASFGLALSNKLSMNWGAHYQRHDQTTVFRIEERRFFISMRYHAPELLRFAR